MRPRLASPRFEQQFFQPGWQPTPAYSRQTGCEIIPTHLWPPIQKVATAGYLQENRGDILSQVQSGSMNGKGALFRAHSIPADSVGEAFSTSPGSLRPFPRLIAVMKNRPKTLERYANSLSRKILGQRAIDRANHASQPLPVAGLVRTWLDLRRA